MKEGLNLAQGVLVEFFFFLRLLHLLLCLPHDTREAPVVEASETGWEMARAYLATLFILFSIQVVLKIYLTSQTFTS